MSDVGAVGRQPAEESASKPPLWLVGPSALLPRRPGSSVALYEHEPAVHRFMPDPAGPVPGSVPWWGTVGGVTISLTGIFQNAKLWDRSYQSWHVARPFLGGIVGSVGFLIFLVVIRATGTIPNVSSTISKAAFDLVALLVGYREDVFRELLKRSTDVLLAPGRREK